jgi:16S rRNA (guanine966-N2)-methyltransferase
MAVRIEGGLLKGLPLKTDTRAGVIRPTSGKVRQALFNMLGDRVPDGAFLDLFAGSAAVAFEALSRGAAQVVAVERHAQAFSLIRQNADLVTSKGQVQGRFEPMHLDAAEYCDMPEAQAAFDVVFADPPFTQSFAGVAELLAQVVKPNGIAVLQYPTRTPPAYARHADRLKVYGESTLAFFDCAALARASQQA